MRFSASTEDLCNRMRISWEASKTCEPLFRTYVEAMATLVLFQRTHFETGPSGADVASDTLRILTSFQIDRCQGAYCLLVNGLVWDAEIVLRAAYETFAKVALIASSSPSQRASLVDEYWNDLSDIYDRKGASKAAAAERLADEHDPQSVRVFAALQDEKHFNLDPKGNKAARSKIEQRWSFSGILYRLSQDGSDLKPVGLDGLAHMYSMASHIAHANSKALELMQDRQLRF